MSTDPALKGVPRELRPFARKLENPVKRPGDDPRLDTAVTQLRELSGRAETKDPLFYAVEAEPRGQDAGDGAGERGIGNVRVYVAPHALPGAKRASGETKRRWGWAAAGVVGAAVVGLGVAGVTVMLGLGGGGESARWARDGVRARVVESAAGVRVKVEARAEEEEGAGAGARMSAGAAATAGAEEGAGEGTERGEGPAVNDAGAGAAATKDTGAKPRAVSTAVVPAMRRPAAARKSPQATPDVPEGAPTTEPAATAVQATPADPFEGAIYR